MDEQDYLDFLMEVLGAFVNSNDDPKVVYSLLQANLDKLDDNFVHFLQKLVTAKLSELKLETEEAKLIADTIWYSIWYYCHHLDDLPLWNKANDMEIMIAGFEAVLKVYTRKSNREYWAMIQNNLGIVYGKRVSRDQALNLENAIAAYNLALEVSQHEASNIRIFGSVGRGEEREYSDIDFLVDMEAIAVLV